MPYEDLAVQENFSDDEITFALNRQNIKDRKDKIALQKAKILKMQIQELKRHSIDGMKAIIETVSSIDENSKKILFKHFDQKNVNYLAKMAPELMSNIQKVAQEAKNLEIVDEINSEQIPSDSSGNHSEEDEINKIQKLKFKLGIEAEVLSENYDQQESNGKESQLSIEQVDKDNIVDNVAIQKSDQVNHLKMPKVQTKEKNE